ncbi:MAG: alpha/beta hydrolase-fold protein [Tepidisphaeraceae bacterium]
MRTALVSLFVLLVSAPVVHATKLHLLVSVPKETPTGDTIYIAGSVDALGNWKADGKALTKTSEDLWSVELDLPAGTNLEFKFNRGTWETVEKTANGDELPNRQLTVGEKDQTEQLRIAKWASDMPVAHVASTVVGTLKLHEGFQSKALGNSRTIRVWLPPGYGKQDRTKHYPVLYMHDGQNLFDKATSFAGEWQLDETATKLIEDKKIEPIIIVGIDNTGVTRTDEYTPVKATLNGSDAGGKADAYAKFVIEEVKPFIDSHYQTKPEPQFTAVGGSSLGGLVSLELGRLHPEVFGKVAAVSPSLWWGGEWMLKQDMIGLAKSRVWIDMGTAEGSEASESQANLAQARGLAEKLKELKIDVKFVEAPDAHHNEQAWSARAGQVLAFLFPAP